MDLYLEGVYLVGVLPGVRGCPRVHLPAQGVLGLGSTMLPSVVKRQNLLALLILLWLNPGGSVQKQHWPGRETTSGFVHVASVTEKGRAGSSPHSPGLHHPHDCSVKTVLPLAWARWSGQRLMGSGAAGSWRLWRRPVLHWLPSFGISWGQGLVDSVRLRDSGHLRASSLSTGESCAMGTAGASRQELLRQQGY